MRKNQIKSKIKTVNLTTKSVDDFRIRVVSDHIIAELFMNSFLTRYFLEIYDGNSIFTDLVLNWTSFFRKYQTINTIFNKGTYHMQLKNLYSNFKFQNNKVVGLKLKNGKILSSKKLISELETLNIIRNHLFHNLVMDTSSNKFLKKMKNSKIDMNLRGDIAQSKRSYRYIRTFFMGVRLISLEKEKIKNK